MIELSKLLADITELANSFPGDYSSIASLRKFSAKVEEKYPSLGYGAFRSVFGALDDSGNQVVMKITKCYNDTDRYSNSDIFSANRNEWEAFNDVSENYPDLKELILAPLAFWQIAGHTILVCPFIKKIELNYPLEFDTMIKDDKVFCRKYLRIHGAFFDTHEGNVGLHEGNPVLFDYNFGVNSKSASAIQNLAEEDNLVEVD